MAISIESIKKQPAVNKLVNKEKEGWHTRDIKLFGQGLPDKKKEHFFLQFSILLSSGIDLRTCFELYIEELNKKKDIELFQSVYNQIVAGSGLFEAMDDSGQFSNYDCYSIKVGEETGHLQEVINEIAHYYHKKLAQRRQIVSVITYPCIVMLTAGLAILFMVKVVIPLFADIYQRSNLELPALTQSIIKGSALFSRLVFYLIVLLPFLIGTHLYFKKNTRYRSFLSQVTIHLPLAGGIIKLVYKERFFQSLLLLTRSRVAILDSVKLLKGMIDFYPIECLLEQVEKDILSGHSFHYSLKEHRFFEKRTLSLIKIGEEANSLANSFEKIREQISSQVEQKIGALQNILEPVLIIFIGLIVGVILVAMYLPLFQVGNTLG